MPVKTRNRRYRSLVKAVFSRPWAILPEKMDAIAELIELRAAGQDIDEAAVQAALAERDRRSARAGTGSIAVMNMFGVLAQRMGIMEQMSGGTSTEAFGRAFDELVANNEVSTIVLNVDSPGGDVFGTRELADKIFSARGRKRVIAVVNSMAASGAYWIASSASELIITPGGAVGSIGVLMMHTDTSGANEKRGIKRIITRIPDGKAVGAGGEPLSEEELTHRGELVRKTYQAFIGTVARNRGVTADAVMSNYGGGRMLLAEDALTAGMVDRIATFDEVMSELLAGGSQPSSGRASAPAFSLKGVLMNPKIFGALVRIGMIEIQASEDDAQKALARFFAVRNLEDPKDDEKRLTVLNQYIEERDAAARRGVQPQSHLQPPAVPPAQPQQVQQPQTSTVTDDRAGEIMAAVKMATGISDERKMELASELITNKSITLSAAIKRISDESAKAAVAPGATILATEARRDKLVSQAMDSILADALPKAPKQIWDPAKRTMVDYKPGQRNYRFAGLMGLAEECLLADGYDSHVLRSLAPMEVAQLALGLANPREFGLRASSDGPAYNTTGTFPNLMIDAANVVLRASYDEMETTYQIWMKRGAALPDFKKVHKIIAGELSDPKAVPEDGEFEEATMSDSKESYALTVWGQVFSLTWQAMLNDSTGSFMEIPLKLGRAMRRKQNRLAYQAVKDNAALADNVALFSSATHNNLTTGALSDAAAYIGAWNTMQKKMAQQKGLDDASGPLNIRGKYIVFPFSLRGIIRQSLGSPSVHSDNPALINIWQQGLTPVEDEELGASTNGGSDTAFYMAADPRDVDTIEYAFLQGLETPRLEEVLAFDRMARRWRIYQAFAVKPLDYRGLQKHTGA